MVTKDVKLIDVIQVMLVRWILLCQRQSRPLWEFNLKKHQTLKRLFETTHEDAWKLLFKGNETPPATDSDRGHDINHLTNEVSFLTHPLLACFKGDVSAFNHHSFFRTGWRGRSGSSVRLRCLKSQSSRGWRRC